MDGILGYELDSLKLTKEEKDACREQIHFYKKHYHIIADGDYYRLSDPFQNGPYTAWEHVSRDKKEALVSLVTGPFRGAPPFLTLRLKGLSPGANYQINGEGSWPGDVLMQVGCPLPMLQGDYRSLQFYLNAK